MGTSIRDTHIKDLDLSIIQITMKGPLCVWIKVKHKQGRTDGVELEMEAVGVWMAFQQVIAPFAASPLKCHKLQMMSLSYDTEEEAHLYAYVCVAGKLIWRML